MIHCIRVSNDTLSLTMQQGVHLGVPLGVSQEVAAESAVLTDRVILPAHKPVICMPLTWRSGKCCDGQHAQLWTADC